MLNRLIINNVALISSLSMELDRGLNILTGETGAGKSIIVDSLMLLLGGRYDKTMLKYGENEGFVEGFFSDVDSELFDEIGIDADDDAVIRRKFNKDGKNDIRINGQTVTLSMLKRFSSKLVDIYGQNEHQSLTIPAKHLDILDYYVRDKITVPLDELEALVTEYTQTQKKLSGIGDEEQRKRNIDILKYQIEEIHNAKIEQNEEEELVDRRKILLSSERIKTSISDALMFLNGDESSAGVCELLRNANKSLSYITSLSATLEEFYNRIDAVMTEISDIVQSFDVELQNMDFDQSDLDDLEKRLDTIRGLKRKYGDYVQMQNFLKKSEEELDFLQNADDMYEKLTDSLEKIKRQIYNISFSISQIRKKCAINLEQKVIVELAELGMKDSRFEIVFSEFPAMETCESFISKNGMDKAEFYLSANQGQPLLPLAKIISGGEMSRFMLALKVISSGIDTVQTMIFDEIDAGISGSIGRIIAQKLAGISRQRQVICVTHLPQIAAMADTHYFINKEKLSGETLTTVTKLLESQMIDEISRLSGGQDISTKSHASAKEIKDWSNSFKNKLA